MNLKIDAEFKALIPPLRAEELQQLELNLLADGCRDPLVTWQGILLDGHNRHEICEVNGLPYKTVEADLPSRDNAKLWILENQKGRRNLTEDQRAVIVELICELRTKLTKQERASGAGKQGGRNHPKVSLSDTLTDKLKSGKKDSRKATAKEYNVAERKLRSVKEVREGAPDLYQKVADGKMSLADARREVKKKAIIENLNNVVTLKAKELAGTYDVIVIDPPWPMEKIERDERPNQSAFDYPTMTLVEITKEIGSKLKAHAADDCHVFPRYITAPIASAHSAALMRMGTFL